MAIPEDISPFQAADRNIAIGLPLRSHLPLSFSVHGNSIYKPRLFRTVVQEDGPTRPADAIIHETHKKKQQGVSKSHATSKKSSKHPPRHKDKRTGRREADTHEIQVSKPSISSQSSPPPPHHYYFPPPSHPTTDPHPPRFSISGPFSSSLQDHLFLFLFPPVPVLRWSPYNSVMASWAKRSDFAADWGYSLDSWDYSYRPMSRWRPYLRLCLGRGVWIAMREEEEGWRAWW